MDCWLRWPINGAAIALARPLARAVVEDALCASDDRLPGRGAPELSPPAAALLEERRTVRIVMDEAPAAEAAAAATPRLQAALERNLGLRAQELASEEAEHDALGSWGAFDPVLFLEPKAIYRKAKGEVPEEDYTVPLGEAAVRREGSDITLVCWGAMLPVCMEAAKRADDDGISCEVIDLRTLVPLDETTLLESVKKTGRMIVVHEAQRTSGFGGELIAIVAEKALEYLEAPVKRVTGFDTPFPYTLEDVYMPDPDRVLRAILETSRYVS